MGICGCLTAQVAACILYIVSSIFMTIGVAIAALGCVLYFGGSFVFRMFSSLLESIGGANIGGQQVQIGIADLQNILSSWSTVVNYAGLILLGLGLFFLAAGILGCVGACCRLKVVLIVYVVITLTITLALVGFVIGYYLFRQNMKDLGAQEMRKLITSHFQGRAHPNPNDFTRVFDIIQGRLECCGVSNYTEFYTARQWNRTYYHSDAVGYVNLTIPVSCCKLKLSDFEPVNKNCTFDPTRENSNFQTGCYEKLWGFMDSFANGLMIGISITAAVSGVISALAIVMLCYHVKNDITPI